MIFCKHWRINIAEYPGSCSYNNSERGLGLLKGSCTQKMILWTSMGTINCLANNIQNIFVPQKKETHSGLKQLECKFTLTQHLTVCMTVALSTCVFCSISHMRAVSLRHSVKYIYIYIYAFSRRFYPKRLTVNSGYTCFCQYMCFLGIEPTTFALLTQCSTTEPQEHK